MPSSSPTPDPGELLLGLQLHGDAGGDSLAQLRELLAGPGETDPRGRRRGVQRVAQLRPRCHVETVDLAAQVLQQRRHRVGLDGVVEPDVRRQRRAQLVARARSTPVVGEERRAADPLGQPLDGDAAQRELAVALRAGRDADAHVGALMRSRPALSAQQHAVELAVRRCGAARRAARSAAESCSGAGRAPAICAASPHRSPPPVAASTTC